MTEILGSGDKYFTTTTPDSVFITAPTTPLITPQTSNSGMEGDTRRAPIMLISPVHSGIPEQELGNSTDIDRSEDDVAPTTGKKPRFSGNMRLSVISESPAREAAGSQEETAALPAASAVKSPLSQEVKHTADPNHAAASQPPPQTAGARPAPTGYIPPPDAINDPFFTDDLVSLHDHQIIGTSPGPTAHILLPSITSQPDDLGHLPSSQEEIVAPPVGAAKSPLSINRNLSTLPSDVRYNIPRS